MSFLKYAIENLYWTLKGYCSCLPRIRVQAFVVVSFWSSLKSIQTCFSCNLVVKASTGSFLKLEWKYRLICFVLQVLRHPLLPTMLNTGNFSTFCVHLAPNSCHTFHTARCKGVWCSVNLPLLQHSCEQLMLWNWNCIFCILILKRL